MIPIYRSTLTRLDLSSVLNYMVDNTLEGELSGQQLAKDICMMTDYAGAIALRSPVDAVVYAMEVMQCDTILMPILTPHVLSSRLQSLGKKIVYYDIDIETMSPIFHQDYPIQYIDNMMKVTMRFLGGVIDETHSLPEEFVQLPTIEVCWALDKSNIVSHQEEKQSNTIRNNADFMVLLLEQNTVCTSGGGAILLASDKKRAKILSHKINHFQSWVMLTDFNASLALAQLKQMKHFVERIEKMLPLYRDAIQRTRHCTLPLILHEYAIPQCFPIMLTSRVNEVVKNIRKQGVECVFPFQYSALGIMIETLTNDREVVLEQYSHALKYVTNVIGMPLYPALDNDEVGKVIQTITNLL